MKIIILLTLLIASNVNAESYLCTAEAAAGIVHSKNGKVESFTSSLDKLQYVMTNTSGTWILKEVGLNYPLPLDCQTKYYCEYKGGNGDFFWRTSDGYFEYYKRQPNIKNPDIKQVGIIGGRCIGI